MQTVSTAPPPALDALALAGALCARLCHDLAGSLGALTGTLELAAEDGDREALDLALTLSHELGARLRLLRAAWGAASEIPAPETLLAGLPGAERLRLECAELRAGQAETLRLVLALLLVAAASLPRGGVIRLAGDDNTLSLVIDGTKAAFPEALADCLASDQALLACSEMPRSVGVALACLLARATARDITLDTATTLTVTRTA